MRDLGALGQSEFARLCAARGIIANPAQIDKRGWDYHLEIPIERQVGDASSMHRGAIVCRVQIKSTEKNRLTQDIEYSNLHSLVTCAEPSFYVLLVYEDDADSVSEIYIKHVDEKFSQAILKKMREREINEPSFKANVNKKTIKFKSLEKLSKPTSHEMKSAILGHIKSYDSYVAKKNKFLELVGYEDGKARVEITIKGPENIRAFEDMLLGIAGSVPVQKLKAHEKRFGILSSSPFIDMPSGTIEVKRLSPSWSGTVVIRSSQSSPKITFACEGYWDIYQSSLPLSRNFIKTDYFTIFIDGGNYRIESTVTNETELSLKNLMKFIRAMTAISQAGCTLELVSKDFGNLATCNLRGCEGPEKNTLLLPQRAKFVAEQFDVDDDILVTINSLHDHKFKIQEFYRLFNEKYHPVRFKFPTSLNLGQKSACISIVDVVLGSTRLVAFFVLLGEIDADNKITGHPLAIQKFVWEIGSEDKGELINTAKALVEEYSREHVVSFTGFTWD